MATHARQQYFADESSLSKEKREFSIAEEVQQKIDSIEEWAQVNTIETIKVNWSEVEPDENKAVDLTIPWVVDSLDSTSSTDALSARQGKVLYDYIQDVSHIGHFLALWDASTWLPVTDPETSPYIYNTWDFYTVSVVAPQWGTNYKPDGTQYVIWQASTTVDTDDVEVNDFYFYDGTTWRHMKNSWAGSIAIDGSLSTTSTNPVENRVITNAINWKQETLIAWDNIQIAQDWKTISATDTKYTAWNWVNISNYVISADTSVLATKTELNTKQDKLIPWSNIQIASDWKTISATDTKYTAWTWINIDANNEISADTTVVATKTDLMNKQDTLTAWSHIEISNADVISTTGLQEELTAWDNITIENVCHKNTQWPCPNGFHIPKGWWDWGLHSEFWLLLWVLNNLWISLTTENVMTYLKMPKAWVRRTNWNPERQGDYGFYWASEWDVWNGYSYRLDLPDREASETFAKYGEPIRPFKDTPVIPDNTWTTLYDWSSIATWAWVFHSVTLWLISLSSDWATWHTISDKNLWATTVWNDWDTLNEANCWKYFQHWNCYWFPFTGSINVSSTLVDVSGYWPWNYYYSDTFIDWAPQAWQSSSNENLWWWSSDWTRCALEISATDTTYTAGTWISIDANNVISNTQTSAEWWNITWTLSDQTDLNTALSAKADDSGVVHNTWAETIAWVKTFSSSPIVPTPTNNTDAATKKYVDDQVFVAITGVVTDTAYWTSWDGVTKIAPSKNAVYDKISTMDTAISGNTTNINTINSKIPSEASASNQLADKAFVGDSINSVAAYYITKNAAWDQWANRAELFAATTFYSGWVIRVPTKNDYTIVLSDENHDNATTRYIYNNGWEYQYTVNETAMTQAQLDALNSGITASKVANYDTLNTKTFSWTWNTTLWQEVYDWIKTTWHYALVQVYNWANSWRWNVVFSPTTTTTGNIDSWIYEHTHQTNSWVYYGELNRLRMVVSNWIVSSVSEYGDVIFNNWHVVIKNDTAPSNAIQWSMWYDTVNNKLKAYDGTNWNEVGKEYNAGEWIEIWNVAKNWRQWPSPDGFHVPSTTERQWLKTIMDWLSLTDWNDWKVNLHMPYAGIRVFDDTAINFQGNGGYYWASTPHETSSGKRLTIASGVVGADHYDWRSNANSIRSFKDSYVTPDSTWTVVQGTLWNAWIFWNQSEWLISITDWTTGYTIMDKNLWATTVYNNWDTLTQSNMGNLYQWWNNYWFPSTWTIANTSSTQVDASSYWPTNPYSSDTFIVWSTDWSSVHNDDLWWDVTGIYTQENVISNTWVTSFNGNTWAVTYTAPVTSVNWQTWNVTISWWDVQVSTQANNILTSWMKIWAGTEANYWNLGTYDSNTLYLTVE